jgi:hypothetical protein
MRLDRPGGFYALYVPCLSGVLYAAITSPIQTSPAFIADRIITLLLCCAEQPAHGMTLSTGISTRRWPGAELGLSLGVM